jgi:predicted permease
MRWLDSTRMRCQMLFRRGREMRRLDAELAFHLEQQIAENVAAGMSPAEARGAALRAFGNPALLRDQARDTWAWSRLALTLQTIRIGIRTLARMSGFASLSILVIAIGIGANVTLFTVVRSVLLEPLPFKDASRLMRLYEYSSDGKFPHNIVAGGVFAEWREHASSFSNLAILVAGSTEYNLSGGGGGPLPEKVRAALCSWSLFPTLGVAPAFGRGFTAADDRPAAPATVVLSWRFWQRRFGADPAILNRVINLNARAYTVIGVMPRWFAYPDQSVQLWTPVYHELPAREMQSLQEHIFVAVGRLQPRATQKQALLELSLIVRRLRESHSGDPFVSRAANLQPLLDDIVGGVKGPLYLLLAATACVLIIACLNVANLLMARAASRQRELAIRAALGSSRLRLLGQQLMESLLLSAAGGAVGLLLASAVTRWLVSTRQDMSRSEAIHVDGVVVAFTLGLMFFCAAFAGLISAASGEGDGILAALQASSRSLGGSHARAKLRQMLVALEVGLTVVLLITAGLLLKSYQRLRAADLGCIRSNVLTMRFSLPEARYPQRAQRVAFFEGLLARVRALPGVQAAGLASAVPGQGYLGDYGFAITEHPPLPVGQGQYAIHRAVDPGYFAALGIPILSGATFAGSDRLERADRVILSNSFARTYFPGEDPKGKHLTTHGAMGTRPHEVIGVVGDTRYLAAAPAQPIMYFPLYAGRTADATLAVRSPGDVRTLALPIQHIVQELDHDLPVADVLTMDELIAKSTVDASFEAILLLAFAVLSLILAAVGLFGVLSYLVAQRTAELGVRIALGARREVLLRLVLLDGLRPALAGVALGIVVSVATASFLRSMLYGISPLDPDVFVSVTAALLLVAAAACIIPARRAARLDPIAALRAE